ncbi:MAG: TIGR02678 family protein [Chromatiaceae bacterium]|nr:MAG: TIGR02678 family protein [Chromatiaceae bacterium]
MPAPNTTLPDALERARAEERQRALRALLLRPLMDARHPAFPLVRRHQKALREWLAGETGWHLQVESEFARLHKRPADLSDPTRPATTGSGAQRSPFSRRRYTLLCLMLADMERGDNQVTLGRLGEGLIHAATDPTLEAAGLHFSLEGREDRRDLVATVRLLLEHGVLQRVAGDEDAFVQQGSNSDVLYDINRRILAALLVTVRGPSLVTLEGGQTSVEQRLQAITARFIPDTDEGRRRTLRQDLTARLLDDPVVYWDDLDEDARQYLTMQRSAITRRISEAADLVPEARAEGIAMVDPQRSLSDQHMPHEGTEGHVTLLVADHLARAPADSRFTLDEVATQITRWRQQYRRYWRRSAAEPGAERALARQALEQLRGLRLIRLSVDDTIEPLPALARFAVDTAPTGDGVQANLTTGDNCA